MGEDTDLLEANRELREAVRARDEFLAIAAHELRSPMHALMLQVASAIALARRAGNEELLQRLERVRVVLDRYVKRANLLLDVSRINAGSMDMRFEELDLAEVLREVIDTLRGVPAQAVPRLRTARADRVAAQSPAIVISPMSTEPQRIDPRESTSPPTATMSR